MVLVNQNLQCCKIISQIFYLRNGIWLKIYRNSSRAFLTDEIMRRYENREKDALISKIKKDSILDKLESIASVKFLE